MRASRRDLSASKPRVFLTDSAATGNSKCFDREPRTAGALCVVKQLLEEQGTNESTGLFRAFLCQYRGVCQFTEPTLSRP
jgi:hypothetical protein